jgi:hypothetical protein
MIAVVFVLLPLTVSAIESCVAGGSCGGGGPVILDDVEQQELNEAAALRVELMQRTVKAGHIHKEVANVDIANNESVQASSESAKATSHINDISASASAAAKAADASNAASEENDPISMDHNGRVCMLCNKPLPERTNKNYTEFRTDCGRKSSSTGPSKAALNVAAVSLHEKNAAGQVESNGFCELNFAKSCADAVANQDYLYWPKSINLNGSSSRNNAAWDARYCALNGFLEHDVVRLQHDFEGLRDKGKSLCETKYSNYNIEKLSFMDMMGAARYDDETAPKLEEAELLAAWNCAMGDLGCDLALCAYSFCKKDASTGHGLYDECEGWDPVSGMPFAATTPIK